MRSPKTTKSTIWIMCHGPTGFPLRWGRMLDSTEIKGAIRLKISHWPKLLFLLFIFPDFFWRYYRSLGYIKNINPKLSQSKSTLHYKSDQATQKSIFYFSWSRLLALGEFTAIILENNVRENIGYFIFTKEKINLEFS